MRAVCFDYIADGWGTGEVWICDGLLVHHELASRALPGGEPATNGHAGRPATTAGPRQGGTSSPEGTVAGELQQDRVDFVSDLCRRFIAHLGGCEVDYSDVPIDLDWCTPLQHDLVEALRRVAWGEVVSYGELAERAGRPRAPRAAGSFCAQNRLQLVLPCHRVIASEGIGGYGTSGVALKRRLLAVEGVVNL